MNPASGQGARDTTCVHMVEATRVTPTLARTSGGAATDVDPVPTMRAERLVTRAGEASRVHRRAEARPTRRFEREPLRRRASRRAVIASQCASGLLHQRPSWPLAWFSIWLRISPAPMTAVCTFT